MTIRCKLVLLSVLGLAFLLTPSSFLEGQEKKKSYVKDSIDESLKYFDLDTVGKDEFKSRKALVDKERLTLEQDFRKILKGDIDFGQSRASVDKYLNGFFLPRMTHYDDSKMEFGRDRDRLVRQYLGGAKRNDARDYVLDTHLLPYCKKICEGNYHPSSQVNAMSLIAALNRRESVKGDQPNPPIPMTEALSYMINTIDADKPLHLKIVALQGIERHASIDGQLTSRRINQAARNGIRDRMLKILDAAYTGLKTQDDVTYFQQRIATRVLGDIADPGTNNEVAKKLGGMISDKKLKIWLRNDAVQAFAKLNFDNKAETIDLIKQTVSDSVTMVSEFVRNQSVVIDSELKRIRENALVFSAKDLTKEKTERDQGEELQKASAQLGGEFEVGDKSKSNSKPKVELPNYRLNLVRRYIKTVSNTVALAVYGPDMKNKGGLASRVSDADAAKFKQIAVILRKSMRNTDVALFGDKYDARDYEKEEFDQAITERLRVALSDAATNIEKMSIAVAPKKAGKATDDKKKTATEVNPLDGG